MQFFCKIHFCRSLVATVKGLRAVDAMDLDHLGDAYLGANQKAKAVATWKRAVKTFRLNDETKFLTATEAKIKTHSKD